MAVVRPKVGSIQTRYVTPTLGFLQNARMFFFRYPSFRDRCKHTDAWRRLDVPGHKVALISVVFAGLGIVIPEKAFQRRVELYEGIVKKLVWRFCSRQQSLPQPHLSDEPVIRVHYVSFWTRGIHSQEIGFRLIFTFHEKSNVPVQLPDGNWNCSTVAWLDFRRHFICDLVTHCAGGEDETHCPLYTLCRQNGVLWRGKCYSLNRMEPGTSWHRANALCSRLGLGGRLDFYLSSDVDNVLRAELLRMSGNIMLMGAGSAVCLPSHVKCNYQPDCIDASDENDCNAEIKMGKVLRQKRPFIIDLEGQQGFPIITSAASMTSPYCPCTHYLCPSDGNCLPAFTRCNGVADCSGKEDERDCGSYVCPDLYRCRGHDLCVLPSDLCDGVLHCPQHDDERFCDQPCPDRCSCLGYALICRQPFDGRDVPQLRYLDGRNSGMKLEALAENLMLVYLNLARCGIVHISNVTLPNLNAIDLSGNKIATVRHSDLVKLSRLHDVKLSGNPITSLFAPTRSGVARKPIHLHKLDLSGVKLETLNLQVLAPFTRLQLLNLSNSGVNSLRGNNHSSLPRTLRQFDTRGCNITEFPPSLFRGVDNLQVVHAETYKLCCPAVLPEGVSIDNCHAPRDEISSCDNLLRSDFYRVSLYLLATFGLLGNSASFVARSCLKKAGSGSGFSVFVQHLCVSDFLMGVYLVFIGVTDGVFLNNYLWEDVSWKRSALCKTAGFLCLTSCEVSSFIITLITVDRFQVLRFPFTQLRFRSASAQVASAIAWALGGALAAFPLLPAATSWRFYGQTGICVPLPVTRREFAGQGYAFGVMIVLNFVLFILIAGGQVCIYLSIQASKMCEGDTSGASKSRDAAIARRLITVAVSDFLCWFPVGLVGLLAATGTPVPGVVNVVMAIFVLPLNSALNPFLYTLNMLQQRLQKQNEERMLKKLTQEA